MNRAKHLVDRVLGALLIVLMGASVINVLWQVFSRFVLNAPSSFTQELARFLLIWVGVLGAGFGVGKRDHLALEIVPERLDGRTEQWTRISIQVFILIFALGVLIVGGTRLVYIQLILGQVSPSLGIPLGYVYLVLPLTGIVTAFYTIDHINGHLRILREETPNSPSDAGTLDQPTDA